MACNFIIKQEIIDTFNEAMDAFLKDPMCITATLIMPPLKVACSVCNAKPVGGQPTNYDFSGRPKYFSQLGNSCMCNGTGFIQQEIKEEICVRPYWSPKEWLSLESLNGADRSQKNTILVANNSKVQIKTYMYNLPKLLNALYLEFSNVPGLDAYRIYRYSLEGEPVPYGLDSKRYCISFWVRAAGG